MHQHRQLAAIMFTDIAGYTALMGKDERHAFTVLEKSRSIQKPLIEQYYGNWIKELGDGVLSSFATVTDAVQCAIAIQQACAKTSDLKLRIGIHAGEIVVENGDIFGDGVNIASRLQAIAPIGGIWVSEAVYKNIQNHREVESHFVKEEALKHVKEPVRIYQISINRKERKRPSVLVLPKRVSEPTFKKSIAVLPFVNMSNDPDQEYFSDGIAEEITNYLSHIPNLKVAGRTSSFQFKGMKTDLRDVGQKLGVRTVLEGSVRKQGNRLRITAQLIEAENGFHLWSERYDRNLDDVFIIQDEIALAIAEKLKVTLLNGERQALIQVPTKNTDAYELYLKGRFYLSMRGPYLITAISCFEQAINIDPNFAQAYAGYADANLLLAYYALLPPNLVMAKSKQAAERAVLLNPSLSEPYNTLGFYYACFEWNWPLAEKNFLKALELDPHFAQAHYWYGYRYLACIQGNFDAAEKHGQLAIQQEPLSATAYAIYGSILYTAGKYREALTACQKGIELDGNSYISYANAACAYMALQQLEEALQAFERALQVSKRHTWFLNGLIITYCKMGEYEKANHLMDELRDRAKTEYVAGTFAALSAAHLHHVDEAFSFLEKAYQDHDPEIITLKYQPWPKEGLDQDPRFQQLLKRLHLGN